MARASELGSLPLNAVTRSPEFGPCCFEDLPFVHSERAQANLAEQVRAGAEPRDCPDPGPLSPRAAGVQLETTPACCPRSLPPREELGLFRVGL